MAVYTGVHARGSEENTAHNRDARLELRNQPTARQLPERIEAADDVSTLTTEVPADLLDRIYTDLAQRTGADRSGFVLTTAVNTVWNDGALGCPEPGQSYLQVSVPGSRIVISHAGKQYSYHTSNRGFFKYCPALAVNQTAVR